VIAAGTRLRAAPLATRIAGLAVIGLGGFTAALLLPVPRESDEQRDELVTQVADRFPGWTVINVAEGQERSWVVALECDGDTVGFRLLRDPRPVGGLPSGDYWIAPDSASSRATLVKLSEAIDEWLAWRARPTERRELPCDVR